MKLILLNEARKNYYPDFIFEDAKLIIELDGTQHKKTIELDAIRNENILDVIPELRGLSWNFFWFGDSWALGDELDLDKEKPFPVLTSEEHNKISEIIIEKLKGMNENTTW